MKVAKAAITGPLLAALVGACTGAISEGDSAGAGGSAPGAGPSAPGRDRSPSGAGVTPGPGAGPAPAPVDAAVRAAAPARVRRLTPTEIRSSLADIYLGGQPLGVDFPREGQRSTFENHYDALSVPLPVAEALQSAADLVADRFTAGLARAFPCDVARAGEAACVQQFLATYGRRTFRRALTPAETARHVALYATARKSLEHGPALGMLVRALVQSPHFLFRTELGDPAAKPGPLAPLTGDELASQLSYFLWGSAPDDALLDAAATDKLATPAELEAQARRMLADPRARAGLRDFFLQWTGAWGADALAKNANAYPAWTGALSAAAVSETARFFEAVLWGGDATLGALLTSTSTFANADLARLYGAAGPRAATLEAVSLDPKRRSGFLSQAAFLAANTPPAAASPIYLGLFVRNKLLCQRIPDPPADVPPAPEPSANVSTRQRFAQHEASPACAGCHDAIDPIGFGFEQLDNIGRAQELEAGKFPLTGTGKLAGTDVDGPFTGVPELGARLARSTAVADCFAAHALEFALGREASETGARLPIDAAALAAIGKARDARRGDLKELFVAAVATDAFRFRDTTSLTITGGAP